MKVKRCGSTLVNLKMLHLSRIQMKYNEDKSKGKPSKERKQARENKRQY